MAFWDKAKRFLEDTFFEKQEMPATVAEDSIEQNPFSDATGKTNPGPQEKPGPQEEKIMPPAKETGKPAAVKEESIPVAEKRALDGIARDFFDGLREEPPLPVLSEAEKEKEHQRIARVCFRIAEENNLGPAAVWTSLDGQTRTKKDFFNGEEQVNGIVFNAAYASQLSDDELAFVAGRQFARIHCKHEEEEIILQRLYQKAQVSQQYKFRVNSALRRENVFEEDRAGMELARNAGYDVPADLGFLRGDKSQFGVKSSTFDILSPVPTVTERQIALAEEVFSANATGSPYKDRINKGFYEEYIKGIEEAVIKQEQFIDGIMFKDEEYVRGLYVSETAQVKEMAYSTESRIMGHVLEGMKKHNRQLKDWYVSGGKDLLEAVSAKAVLKRVKMLDFSIGIEDKKPLREIFAREALGMVEFVSRAREAVTRASQAVEASIAGKPQQKLAESFRYPAGKLSLQVRRQENNRNTGNVQCR